MIRAHKRALVSVLASSFVLDERQRTHLSEIFLGLFW